MPFTASEDEQPQQLRPASADEEACPVPDHDGISSFILQLTCISTLPATKDDSSFVWDYNRHTQKESSTFGQGAEIKICLKISGLYLYLFFLHQAFCESIFRESYIWCLFTLTTQCALLSTLYALLWVIWHIFKLYWLKFRNFRNILILPLSKWCFNTSLQPLTGTESHPGCPTEISRSTAFLKCAFVFLVQVWKTTSCTFHLDFARLSVSQF